MTFIQPPTLDVLPHPFFIVAEGIGDARFIDKLLQHKNVTNCSVGCPTQQSAQGMGKNAFPKYLAAVQTARTRGKSVPMRGLVIVADANGNADESFNEVVAALQDAKFPAPPSAFNISVNGGGFKTAVYLVPRQGETGTLEHLLLRAVFGKTAKLKKCLDEFSTCSGGLKSTKPNIQAKMRMSALAATFCAENPWCSLANMWSDPNNPVPIDSSEFDALYNFIRTFAV
jgi:hypothetical protein